MGLPEFRRKNWIFLRSTFSPNWEEINRHTPFRPLFSLQFSLKIYNSRESLGWNDSCFSLKS